MFKNGPDLFLFEAKMLKIGRVIVEILLGKGQILTFLNTYFRTKFLYQQLDIN